MHNNCINGIDRITLAVNDCTTAGQFLIDLGLTAKTPHCYTTLNRSEIVLTESNNALIKEITWGVVDSLDSVRLRINQLDSFFENENLIGCKDPHGILITFRLSQKTSVDIKAAETNSWNCKNRINKAVPVYPRAEPIEIGHIVIATTDITASENFYTNLGFVVSDRLVGRGVFLRCSHEAGHHDIFLIQSDKDALHHIAFTTRDIYEIFAGGMYMEKQGWTTEIGPGRHPISSSFFWYFNSPLGGMIEYTCNEDYLLSNWIPRSFEYSPGITTEWAVKGKINFPKNNDE
jgi:catechol 2,3-dioxygenase-like lactoylglutathione lyase family enzyme